MPEEPKKITSLFELLAPNQQLTPLERHTAKKLKAAIEAMRAWEKSGKQRYYGVYYADEQKIKLSREETAAWWKCYDALEEAMRFHTRDKKEPLTQRDLVDIYRFSRKYLHPEFYERFGNRINKLVKDVNFAVQPRVKLFIGRRETSELQRDLKQMMMREEGLSPNEAEQRVKKMRIRGFEIEGTTPKAFNQLTKIGKEWLEPRNKPPKNKPRRRI